MIGNWLQNFDAQEASTSQTGAAALCWEIWRYRNDIIFDNVKHSSFMQVIFRGDLLATILVNVAAQGDVK